MFSRDEIRSKIESALIEVFEERCPDKPVPNLEADTILLETGLDSLGFAVLIVELEDGLGYDPFAEAEEANYPQTFGEFVEYFFRMQP